MAVIKILYCSKDAMNPILNYRYGDLELGKFILFFLRAFYPQAQYSDLKVKF